MPVPVLYFHGFASSPQSQKITALRELLANDIDLVTPDLNVPSFQALDFEAIVAHAIGVGKRCNPQAIVGSSLGAIIALEVVRRSLRAPLVLIAPALGIAQRWRDHIPYGDPVVVFNHAMNAEAPIHRRFFDQIFEVTADAEAPPVRVTALMGRKDETVPFHVVEATWRRWEESGALVAGSRFIELAEGDHGLVSHAETIAHEIRAAAKA